MLTAGRSIVEWFSSGHEGAMGFHRDRKSWRKAPTSGRGECSFCPVIVCGIMLVRVRSIGHEKYRVKISQCPCRGQTALIVTAQSSQGCAENPRILLIDSTCGNDNIPSPAVDNIVAASSADIRCKPDMQSPWILYRGQYAPSHESTKETCECAFAVCG